MIGRRMSLVVVLVMVLGGLSSGGHGLLAGRVMAQSGQTPAAICEAATADAQEPETRQFEQAEDVLEAGADYWAVLCTEAGPITLDLFEAEAPKTVNSFVFLAQQGFFNDTTFHRVLPGFMAQGGDPTATGMGGPGYTFEDETDNGLVFDAIGLLAMANSGPNTNGSQFFITYAPTPWLDGNHTVFGRVVAGMDNAELLTPRDPERSPDYDGAALYTVVIVDDPAQIEIAPDGPPTIEHFQELLELTLSRTLNRQFVLDAERSGVVQGAEAQAAAWDARGSGLGDFMLAYLSANDFVGSATVMMVLSECLENPADLPIWSVTVSVDEFTTAEAAEAAVFDVARAAALESTLFTAHEDPPEIPGRVFSGGQVVGTTCSEAGVLYRLEMPYGRYLLAVELAVDDAFVSPSSDPSAVQYLGFVMQDFLFNAITGTLDRGNASLLP